MPNTCVDSQQVSRFRPPAKPQGQIPDTIAQLLRPFQASLLQRLIIESLDNITALFYDKQYTSEMTTLKTLASTAPHTTCVAIFFLLLNIDQHLKQRIMQLEVPKNHRKLERFLIDLKRTLMIQFFVNENVSVQAFVRQCEEYWVLA